MEAKRTLDVQHGKAKKKSSEKEKPGSEQENNPPGGYHPGNPVLSNTHPSLQHLVCFLSSPLTLFYGPAPHRLMGGDGLSPLGV